MGETRGLPIRPDDVVVGAGAKPFIAYTILSTTEEIWTAFGEHYAVEPLGEGRCRLTWTVSYEATGGFGRAHRWVKPLMGAAFGFYMWRLRRYCRGR